MDPRYCEERLRDEVIYLHSLWHQGPPPRPTPTPPPLYHTPTPTFYYQQQQQHTPPLPLPIPNLTPHYPLYHHQHHYHQPPPIPQPLFTQTGKRVRESDPPPDSGPEWPCLKDPPPQTSSGSAWPPMKKPTLPTATATTTTTQPLSAESQAYQIQHKAFQPCREFLLVKDEDGDEASQDGSSSSSGNEEVDEEEEEEEEEDDELSFFFKLFSEDCELRGYYLKNRDNGDFYCLVCGAIGKKAWKKFKGCVSLLHHATSILKTKRKRAHRAFAQVVCKLLGWDFHRIPNIVFKPQPQPLQLQGGPEGIAVDSKDDSDDVKKDNVAASVNGIEQFDNSISQVTVSNGENANPNHPQHTPTSIPNPNSSPHYPLHHHHPLAPFPQSQLLTQTRKRVGESDPPLDSGPEQPCPQDPPPETSRGWHSMKEPVSTLQPLSAEDQARQMQYKALQPCREFLLARNEDEDKTSEDGNSEEDEEELHFFLKLFSEDRELRSCYEKCYESGDFYCLVCCGTGKTVWKKFKGCVGLLQHSTSILKTKRKRAHRAFAQVICKVLGWDLHRLSARLGSSSASHYCVGLLQLQGGPQEIADDGKDDDDVVKKDNAAACVNGNIGETNAVSVAASSGEVAAASVNGIEQLENSTSVVTVSNSEKAFSINGNSNSGENMVSVDGDHSDAIDREDF